MLSSERERGNRTNYYILYMYIFHNWLYRVYYRDVTNRRGLFPAASFLYGRCLTVILVLSSVIIVPCPPNRLCNKKIDGTKKLHAIHHIHHIYIIKYMFLPHYRCTKKTTHFHFELLSSKPPANEAGGAWSNRDNRRQ